MAANPALDAKFGMMDAVQVEVGEERRILQVRKVCLVGKNHRVELAVDEKRQPVAVGKDGGVLSGAAGCFWAEIPVEVRLDDGPHVRADLGLVERGAQFWNPKGVGHAGGF